ncbi:MAG TPA: hypothetical protein VKX49_30460, partial [Bryobacteraceae bacterium]|nr:hypothetical protein [Bryobacteraceae bacterium]
TVGCGNHQQPQPLTPIAEPLVGDKPSPLQPPVAQPTATAPDPAPAGSGPASRSAAQYGRVPGNGAVAERPPSAVAIAAGTPIDVRLLESIDTKRNRPGDRFDASLTNAIVLDGQTVIPRGTRFMGHLIDSQSSGRLKGHAELRPEPGLVRAGRPPL